ncbi:MAG: CRISPR-associated CARF protein Csa3 [Candidatus Nezhaarchaeales archaeon]
MRKTFIATLGFDQSSIVRLIGERGLSEGDNIFLITSTTPHSRTENALQSIREFVGRINPSIRVEVRRLDEKALMDNVVVLARLIAGVENPVIDVSGGPKMLSLSLFLAACFSGVSTVYMTAETTGERVAVPTLSIPSHILSNRQLEVLNLLPARVSELSRGLRVSKSTISRVLNSLIRKGLVYKRSDKFFEPTLSGSVLRLLLSSEEDLKAALTRPGLRSLCD